MPEPQYTPTCRLHPAEPFAERFRRQESPVCIEVGAGRSTDGTGHTGGDAPASRGGLQSLDGGEGMSALGGGGFGEFVFQVDEHRARDMRVAIVPSTVRISKGPANIEDYGRNEATQFRLQVGGIKSLLWHA